MSFIFDGNGFTITVRVTLRAGAVFSYGVKPHHGSTATALERGNEVATFNRRRFAGIPGLKVIEPKTVV